MCHTVILYGSRARDDFTDASDVDVFAVRDQGESVRLGIPWNGLYLDAWIYCLSEIPEPENLLYIADGIVLAERDGYGKDLLANVRAALSAPVAPLPVREAEMKISWIEKTIVRIESDDAEADYRRHWLLIELLEIWFAFSCIRYRGPKQSLKFIENRHPEVFKSFREGLRPAADLNTIRKLAERVIADGRKSLQR